MSQVKKVLKSLGKKLKGKIANEADLSALQRRLKGCSIPSWFLDLYRSFPLAGATLELDEEHDDSEMGVEMKWLTPQEIAEEASELQPGISAEKLGFLPIGSCLSGSGDPYFLSISDSEDPAVVRIPHDAVNKKGKLDVDQIEEVAPSLSEFLQRADWS